MDTRVIVGLVIVIVAISGATACSYLWPSENTQTPVQSDPTATTAPAVNDQTNTQQNVEQNTQQNVHAQQVTCTKCGGSGAIKCGTCSGKGTVVTGGTCSACGGDGKRIDNGDGTFTAIVAVLGCHEVTCSVCKGTGGNSKTVSCSACGGDGKISCPKCGGDGIL